MTEFEVRLHDYIAQRPDLQNTGFEFRASAAGDCPRLMDYQYQHGKKDVLKPQAERMLVGHAIHSMWQDMIREMYGDGFIGVEEEIKVPFDVDGEPYHITGHPDGVIAPLNSLYELKTCSDFTYQAVRRDDKPMESHWLQANFYAWALSLPMILFHYYNRNTGESLFFEVPSNAEVALGVVEKFKVRIRNKALGVLQDRPYTDATQSPCWFCERKDDCYQDFSSDVHRGVDHVSEDPEIVKLVETINRSRVQRLSSDSQEKLAKSELAHWMISGCIKTLRVGSSLVSVSVGKNNNPLINIKETNNE